MVASQGYVERQQRKERPERLSSGDGATDHKSVRLLPLVVA